MDAQLSVPRGSVSGPRRLCRVEEIPEDRARGFEVEGDAGPLKIFVVRRGDRVHGYVNRCPHIGTPLDWLPDEFLDRDAEHIICATHGALFRVADGRCVWGPCEGDALTPIPLEVVDGVLHLSAATPASAGAAGTAAQKS